MRLLLALCLIISAQSTSAQVHHGGGGTVMVHKKDYALAYKDLVQVANRKWKECYGVNPQFKSPADIYLMMILQRGIESNENCVEEKVAKIDCFTSRDLRYAISLYTKSSNAEGYLSLEVGGAMEARKILQYFNQYRYITR